MDLYDRITEELLQKPCHVVDVLPDLVPEDSAGRYFAVEVYYRSAENLRALHGRFGNILMKLNCYEDLLVWDAKTEEWVKNPAPAALLSLLLREGPYYLAVLIGDGKALLTIDGEDLYCSVYGAGDSMLERISALAGAEGLFVREGA